MTKPKVDKNHKVNKLKLIILAISEQILKSENKNYLIYTPKRKFD